MMRKPKNEKVLLKEALQLFSRLDDERKSCPGCLATPSEPHASYCLVLRISMYVYPEEF